MGVSPELRRSSTQHSKMVDKRFPLPQANRKLKFQDKITKSCDNPGIGLPPDRKQSVHSMSSLQPKSSRNLQKHLIGSKATKYDELVKHMSNVPSYLQRIDKEENFQEKALNFGVLNWERLEKWKYNQKGIPESGSVYALSRNSKYSMLKGQSPGSSAGQVETLAHESSQHSSVRSSSGSSYKGEPPEISSGNPLCSQDASNVQNKFSRSDKSDKVLLKGKEKEFVTKSVNSSVYFKHHGVSINSEEKMSTGFGEAEKRAVKFRKPETRRRSSDSKTNSEVRISLPNLRSNDSFLDSPEKTSVWDDETVKETEKMQEPNVNLTHQLWPEECKNIALLLPRDISGSISSEAFHFTKPRASTDEYLPESSWNSFSDSFSQEEVCASEFYSEIPRSCPLPRTVETISEGDTKPQNTANCEDMERELLKIHKDSTVMRSSKSLDRQIIESAASKSRNASPNRRFSFSLGRMSRSLSFKESSAVPHMSSSYVSVKSGPVSSETSSGLDNTNSEKANATSRARSSPLRRLLDPLMKPNVTNSPPCDDAAKRSKFKTNSLSFRPIFSSDSIQNEKHGATTIQALLQLSIKNGVPLFKFVVENSSSILVATMNNLMTTGKEDSSWNYTLYSVNEIKKKGGSWLKQGNKDKHNGYVYNAAGQMKILRSCFKNTTKEDFDDQCIVRESTLFAVETKQSEQETANFTPKRELAAAVVKIPSQDSRNCKQSNRDTELLRRSTEYLLDDCNLVQDKKPVVTTLILPDGVHGLPNKGAPSPLLDRWRSSGSCDCGGWDVGCKLRILSNQDQCCKVSENSMACPIQDCIELFAQGSQENRPLFRLSPFKEDIFSVDFKSSISLLQAFFTCITVLYCQKSSDLLEMNNAPELSVIRDNTLKTPTTVQGDVPAKYASCPPLSPVGRV